MRARERVRERGGGEREENYKIGEEEGIKDIDQFRGIKGINGIISMY